MPYLGIDLSYLVLVLPAVLLALAAQLYVKSAYAKFAAVPNARGMTGFDAARLILDENGLRHVRIAQVAGELTDHYDPRDETVYLSAEVFGTASVAAVGIASHEAGHAVQHAVGYAPIRWREAIIPVTNIGSNLAMPLVFLGLLLSMPALASLGVLAFGLSTLFQLITLPVELNASSRAMTALRVSGLPDGDLAGAKKVLTAAALTYVAALAVSLANLLRLYLLVSGGKKRR